MFYLPHSPPTPTQLLWFPFLLRATREARNPNLQVIITHTSHVYSQHSFGFPLRMNGMHRTQSDHARFDYLPRKTYAKHSNVAKVF